MKKIAPPADGIHTRVPFEVYRSWDAWNHSALSKFHLSAMHALAAYNEEAGEPTADQQLGSAIHVWILERDQYAAKVALQPQFSGEGSKAIKAAWEAANAHKIIIPSHRQADVEAVGRAIRANAQCRALAMNPGDPETAIVWTDKATGLRLKGRCDKWYGKHGLFLDLKSTRDASERKFTRSIVDYWYWTQAEFYRTGFAACGAADHRGLLLAVEKDRPYGVAIYAVDHWRELAGKQIRNWLSQAKVCQDAGKWPGFVEGIVQTQPPKWLEQSWANFEEAE